MDSASSSAVRIKPSAVHCLSNSGVDLILDGGTYAMGTVKQYE